MTNYEVVAEGGVEVNGSHYDQGHTFEFSETPDYIQPLIDDGSITVGGESQAKKDEVAEDAPADAVLTKYTVVKEDGIFIGDVEHAKGEVVELDADSDETKGLLTEGFVEAAAAE